MSEVRWVLLIASEVGGTDSVSDRAMERLVEAIRLEGYEVVRTSTPEDGLSLVTSDPSYSTILLDWDLEGENQFAEGAALAILRAVRRRNKKIPIFLIADRTLVSELPLEVVKQVHEYIHLFGDTPAFIANRVDFAVERYHEQLLPPYFRELKKYNDQGAYSWDAPGHMGGVAFLKHPVGMEFHKFFGENIMRSDLGISTSPLGSWLDHLGPAGESERNAARIFGADWTFYVLGGSSTSNQIVGHGVIAQDDIVLADANCHKSICHSLTVTGARPVYMKPTRNGYGMIGLVPIKRFSPEFIRGIIDKSPLTKGVANQNPTYAVVTNSTYDGLCYDVNKVVTELSKSVPRVHFDEAWYAYAMFHEIYQGRFAIGVPDAILTNRSSAWTLKTGEEWQGYQDDDIADGYCMLDPTKVTILTPGVNAQGVVSDWGIPAAIITEFLDGRRVEIARTGDYTVLVLFSVGTSKGKWGALPENLFEFKRLYDSEASLEEALPELVLKYPARYRNVTLKELSDEMHAAMVQLNLSGLVNDACDEDFDPVLTPAQTYQKLLRNETEKIRFSEMAGRIAAVMLVPYPPGIPMSMPGERLGSAESPVIKLILAMEEFGKRFPGFEREVHGIEADAEGNYWMRAVIETNGKKRNGNAPGKQRPPSAAPPVKKRKRTSPATTPEVPPTGLSSQR